MIADSALQAMLGIEGQVPLSPDTMACSLKVCLFPGGELTPALERFTAKLLETMVATGVRVIPYEEAKDHSRRGKLKEGIVIIAPGELKTGNLPVDHVSNLRTTTVVGIVEGRCPAEEDLPEQEKLNAIVRHLGWSIVQVLIFVDGPAWTICTMNGAIIRCVDDGSFARDVLNTLVPKLAAPVVPPHASDFQLDEGSLDLHSPAYEPYVTDFIRSAPLWAETGLMLFHTSLEALKFRNAYYRRIAAAYLDRRSGMSYGFLARQTAVRPAKLFTEQEADNRPALTGWRDTEFVRSGDNMFVVVHFEGQRFVAAVPDVSVLSTRSGCDKSHIDGYRDLMLLRLSSGRISLETPAGGGDVDYRPSYDTLTILAHALGNAFILAIEHVLGRVGPFSQSLQQTGMALAHWHGSLDPAFLPPECSVFGFDNPPVSCSTHQAALFALTGKLNAFTRRVADRLPYAGDVHYEPHHGINVTWPSLEGLALHLLGRNGAWPVRVNQSSASGDDAASR